MENVIFTDQETAQNFLKKTQTQFMVKLTALGASAITFLVLILVQSLDFWPVEWNPMVENIYFVVCVASLIIGGGAIKTFKIAISSFKWGVRLTPFYIFDLVIGLGAAAAALILGLMLPFIPIGMELASLYSSRQQAKLVLK